jgi:hypothetical protein
MATVRPDIEIIRGDSMNIDFTLEGVDMTRSTVFFTAKSALDNDVDDSDAAITVEVTDHEDPTAGYTIIPLSSTDTDVTPGVYWYDIQVKKGDNTITSIRARKLEVFADVTRRTS